MTGQKKRAAESDSLLSKSRNDHSEEVLVEVSFAVGVSVHWAEFYADSEMCQGVEWDGHSAACFGRGKVGETEAGGRRGEWQDVCH
jgi:hypothetical protein